MWRFAFTRCKMLLDEICIAWWKWMHSVGNSRTLKSEAMLIRVQKIGVLIHWEVNRVVSMEWWDPYSWRFGIASISYG